MEGLGLMVHGLAHVNIRPSMAQAGRAYRKQPVSPGTCCKQFQFQLCYNGTVVVVCLLRALL
jgi:hypothetical protein